MKPILINDTVIKSVITVSGQCRRKVVLENYENVKLIISKAGRCCSDLLEYKPLDTIDGSLVFFWDNLLYDLPEGRYMATLFIDEECCSRFQMQIGEPCGILNVENSIVKEDDCDSDC